MRVIVRVLTDEDKARFAKKCSWGMPFHNGLICVDIDTGSLFVQEPIHPSTEGLRFWALVDGSFVGLQWDGKVFVFLSVSPVLEPRLHEVRAFVWNALKANQLRWEHFVPPDNPAFGRLPKISD